ncbi:MAG TPA: class I SAM-dependent methyltransferase [Luteimonas sp.]|nr:class I SAM-dependent methyltransferase [Luteimonas sp.]
MPDNVKYDFKVALDDPNNSHSLLHRLVCETAAGPMSVLEVGCSSGYVGATFTSKGHRVTGVEPDPASANAARGVLDEVFTGGIDDFLDGAQGRRFDALLFGDVLEHLADPAATLRRCVQMLAPGGRIGISLPCATHGSIRAMLLGGRWDYGDYGLLDRTHLRFFSREGAMELLAAAGLQAERVVAVLQPIDVVVREYGMPVRPEAIAAVEALADDEDLMTFQFVIRAVLAPDPDDDAGLLARNRAVRVEKAIDLPRIPGQRSLLQRLRTRLLRGLVSGLTRRRFRGTGQPTTGTTSA